jgi:hypothetical protein
MVEPIGFPGDDPTKSQVAEHKRHAALAEVHWFTCPLCDDEEMDEETNEDAAEILTDVIDIAKA